MKKNILWSCMILLTQQVYSQQWSGPNNTTGILYRSGKVGIGLTSLPLAKLHLSSNHVTDPLMIWENTLVGQGNSVNVLMNSSPIPGVTIGAGSLVFQSQGSQADMLFMTNTSNLGLIVKNNGRVGLGLTNPSAKFEVKEEINGTTAIFHSNHNSDWGYNTIFNTNTDFTKAIAVKKNSGPDKFVVYGNGKTTVDATSLNSTFAFSVLNTNSSNLLFDIFGITPLGQVKTSTDASTNTPYITLTDRLWNQDRFVVFGDGRTHINTNLQIGYSSITNQHPTSRLSMDVNNGGGILFDTWNNGLPMIQIQNSSVQSQISTPFVVYGNGKTHIGNGRPKAGSIVENAMLSVDGTILAKDVYVTISGSYWADYVFGTNYELLPLEQVKTFIQQEKHLPGVPSAFELETNGLSLSDMQKIQMEKIEELYLHTISLNEEILLLKKQNEELLKLVGNENK